MQIIIWQWFDNHYDINEIALSTNAYSKIEKKNAVSQSYIILCLQYVIDSAFKFMSKLHNLAWYLSSIFRAAAFLLPRKISQSDYGVLLRGA